MSPDQTGEIGTPGYECIEGWRITPHELGPHPHAESCDDPPVCGHVYRLVGEASEHEVWLHDVALRALMERDESVVERERAVALLRDLRPVLAQMKDDIAAVLTVYDEHVPPENRGPWRDRLAALIGTEGAPDGD